MEALERWLALELRVLEFVSTDGFLNVFCTKVLQERPVTAFDQFNFYQEFLSVGLVALIFCN